MSAERQQFYLRAEPTAEGRALLRAHQRHLAQTFARLRLNPRLTRPGDLHWTAVFLGSPARWAAAFRAIGADAAVARDDVLRLALGNDRRHVREHIMRTRAHPTSYDVFFNGGTGAVFVVRFDPASASPAPALLRNVRDGLAAWERAGRSPDGTAARLLRNPRFPLARERAGGKPHSTLARGRVSRERQRDVLRSIRATPLASRTPILFRSVDLRMVGSPAALPFHD